MTVEERLLFIRAGYSAQDIANFEAAEQMQKPAPEQDPKPAPEQDPKPAPEQDPKPAPEQDPKPAPEQDPKPAPELPTWASALQKSIDNLTNAMQANNARFDDMGDTMTVMQQADNALAEYLTGQKVDTKTKHNGGNK